VVAEREVVGQLAVDVPGGAVLEGHLGLVDLQCVAGAGDDGGPVLEVGRRGADDLAQPLDGGLGDLVFLVEGVEPAGVDAPLVGGGSARHAPDTPQRTRRPHGRPDVVPLSVRSRRPARVRQHRPDVPAAPGER